MRLPFTFVGGRGHCEPLIPVAQAARAAGHSVAFSGGAALMPMLEARGFPAFATTPPTRTGPRPRTPLVAVSMKREERVLRLVFAGRAARERASGILALAHAWRPDLIVGDEGASRDATVAARAGQ